MTHETLEALLLIRLLQQVKTLTLNYTIHGLWTMHRISMFITTFNEVGSERQETLSQAISYSQEKRLIQLKHLEQWMSKFKHQMVQEGSNLQMLRLPQDL